MSSKKLKSSKVKKISSSSLAANFESKKTLNESLVAAKRKQHAKIVKSLVVSPRPSIPKRPLNKSSAISAKISKSVSSPVLSKSLQDVMAQKIHDSYFNSLRDNSQTGYWMWGLGFALPTAFEAVGVASGLTVPDLKTFLIANLVFAAAFRFTVGDKHLSKQTHISKEKSKQAMELLKTRKITSHKAQDMLVKLATSEDAFRILNNHEVDSEAAQILLFDKYGGGFSHERITALLRNGKLSPRLRSKLEAVLKSKTSKAK